MKKHHLIIEQLDSNINNFIGIPVNGWVHSIRTALRMSLRHLGKKLQITAQSVREIESNKKNG